MEELNLAIKAYTQTERLQKEPNPDLYYNRATIFEYLERYNECVRDYVKAHQIDPNLHADYKAERVVNFVIQASNMIQSKGKLKQKKITEMVKSVPTSLVGAVSFPSKEEQKEKITYNVVSFGDLEPGENKPVILSAKIVSHLQKEQDVPMSFLAVDFKYVFSVISLYQTNKALAENVKPGDAVLIKSPNMIYTSLEYKGKLYTFQTIKVTEIGSILING